MRPWLQECSYTGCADFLEKLQPEVCLKGDTLLRAGTISELFYILISGELQIVFPPDGAQVRKILSICGNAAAAASAAGAKQSSRVPQGRVERCGALVGWSAPYSAILPSRYGLLD